MLILDGDLLQMAEEGHFDAIVHGCNCFKAMNSGIAKAIAERYPQVKLEDDISTVYGSASKLGSYGKAYISYRKDDEYSSVGLKHAFTVINAYTQYAPGADFIASVFPLLVSKLNTEFKGKRLGFPMIGCGVGGGDWGYVMRCLLYGMPNVDVTVVIQPDEAVIMGLGRLTK